MIRFLYLSLLFAALGCQPARVPVRGQVTFEGIPLEQGQIVFLPASGGGSSGEAKIEDGRYEVLPGLVRGDYNVEIRSWKLTGKRIKGIYGEMTEERINIIPDRYHKDSVLKFTAADDPEKMDFQLTKK